MTSFNTGATNSANTASSVTLAIPAGVLVGDVMIMALEVFTQTSTTPTISFSGAGGGWTLVPMNTGTNPEVATAGSSVWSYGFAYYRVATAGDQGATLTITESGSAAGTTWFAVAMGAYSGANTSTPIDVAFGNNAQGTTTGTAPSGNTGVAGDWAIHLACVGINNTPLTGPGTSRENIVSSALVGAAVDDSNGSVGGAGTSIGGGTWTQAGNASDWWSLFEIGLAPPSAGISGTIQPRATIPVPRRKPARALWAGITGQAYVAVPAPRQQPGPAPRRKPARAYVRFTPVTTTNSITPPPPLVGPPPVIPTSGGDRGVTIRVFREIRPGDVPDMGAQLPRLTGRAFAMPVPADVEHAVHAWPEPKPDPKPDGPTLIEQLRAELDDLATAARDIADAAADTAARTRPHVEKAGRTAYNIGKIFGTHPYDPKVRRICGTTKMTGGQVLTCQRKPHDSGWHTDKGLHWR